MQYYLGQKRNKILSLVMTWISLEDTMFSEISQIWKDKYHMLSYMKPKTIDLKVERMVGTRGWAVRGNRDICQGLQNFIYTCEISSRDLFTT